MDQTLCMVLAGGEGQRLHPLTEHRSKPAMPFGGSYRLIDFVLSNLINSHCRQIYVLTQFRSQSLYLHLKSGWTISGLRDCFIEPIPAQMQAGKRWYNGTADAIYQNMYFIDAENPARVCIFSSDHVYRMDVRPLLAFHHDRKADLTVAAIKMPLAEASRFGVIEVDASGRMIGFEEKPAHPKAIPADPTMALVSMGNYVFETACLRQILPLDAANLESSHDFGKDIIPILYPQGRVFVYDVATQHLPGEQAIYWRDVGSLDSYWAAHMDLLGDAPLFNLDNPHWPLQTYHPALGSAYVAAQAQLEHSFLAAGSRMIGGTLRHSIVGFNCQLDHATIDHSILLGNVSVGAGCHIVNTIIDKNAAIAPGIQIGTDPLRDAQYFQRSEQGIFIVPKGAKIGY